MDRFIMGMYFMVYLAMNFRNSFMVFVTNYNKYCGLKNTLNQTALNTLDYNINSSFSYRNFLWNMKNNFVMFLKMSQDSAVLV